MMDRIHGLPFITGGFMAVMAGIISYVCRSDNQSTYIRMAIVMVVFYMIGVYIRNTLTAINTENEEKKELERLREQEEAAQHAASQEGKQNDGGRGRMVNLVADDSDDEFTPLTVSQVISSKLSE